ncbi:MAG: hypothetical protein ACEPOV_01970 [Hyphomicrobiales bacterium]
MKKVLLSIFMLAMVVAACKKSDDKDSTPSVDNRIVGTWKFYDSFTDPQFGFINETYTRSYTDKATFDYLYQARNSSGSYNYSNEDKGSFTLSQPESGVAEEYAKALNLDDVKFDFKIVAKGMSTYSGYLQFTNDNKSVYYFSEDSDGKFRWKLDKQ